MISSESVDVQKEGLSRPMLEQRQILQSSYLVAIFFLERKGGRFYSERSYLVTIRPLLQHSTMLLGSATGCYLLGADFKFTFRISGAKGLHSGKTEGHNNQQESRVVGNL